MNARPNRSLPVAVAALCFSLFVGSAPARATLIGDKINAAWSFLTFMPNNKQYQDSTVIGPEIEFISKIPSGGFIDLADFDADSVTLAYRGQTNEAKFNAKRWNFDYVDFAGESGHLVDIVASPANPPGANGRSCGGRRVCDRPAVGQGNQQRYDLVDVPDRNKPAQRGL